MSGVLDSVAASVSPASAAQAAALRARLERSGSELGSLLDVASRLAAARHSPVPSLKHKVALIVAADHGHTETGVDLAEQHPTTVAMRHLAGGGAALSVAARSAEARVVLVDAGIRGAAERSLGAGVMPFRIGDGTRNIGAGPAMSRDDAVHALQTGIALVFSLADTGLDALALGHLAPGSEPSSACLVARLTGTDPAALDPQDQELVATALAANRGAGDAIDTLAQLGGFEHGVLAGAIVAAASIHVPVVLDDHGAGAAALVAEALQPDVRGYLFASHRGRTPSHRESLRALELRPLLDLGLAHGEGTGALLALPLLDAAARVCRELR